MPMLDDSLIDHSHDYDNKRAIRHKKVCAHINGGGGFRIVFVTDVDPNYISKKDFEKARVRMDQGRRLTSQMGLGPFLVALGDDLGLNFEKRLMMEMDYFEDRMRNAFPLLFKGIESYKPRVRKHKPI